MSQAQLFTLTSNFKSAIALINGLEVPRLPVILARIIRKLETSTDEPPFSEAEEAQLLKVFFFFSFLFLNTSGVFFLHSHVMYERKGG